MYDYDLFCIGAGSGGTRASRMAAAAGAKVAVAEERFLGGTCVNIGCVPKKMFVYAGHYAHDFEDAHGYGWDLGPRRFDWARFKAARDAEISRLNGIYETLITTPGAEIIDGRATVVDPHTVDVNGTKITAEKILIATGSRPTRTDEPGARDFGSVSDDMFELETQPERVLVAGGGYIAVEFAGIFNALGSETRQLYRGDLFLRGFDDDVRRFLKDEMLKAGVKLGFGEVVSKVEKTAGGLACTLSGGDRVEVDTLLYAIGRTPNTDGLGLETAGVTLGRNGAVPVDAQFRTNVPSIFAIGDVIGGPQLTPLAITEAMAFVSTQFRDTPQTVDYDAIPTAVFSTPPIGTVGLTEAEARKRHGAVDVYVSEFKALKHTLTGRSERTLMKMVVEPKTDKVVGCHMVGPDAGEITQGLGIAIKAGATKADFDATVGIHPTAAEEFVTMRTKRPEPQPAQAAE